MMVTGTLPLKTHILWVQCFAYIFRNFLDSLKPIHKFLAMNTDTKNLSGSKVLSLLLFFGAQSVNSFWGGAGNGRWGGCGCPTPRQVSFPQVSASPGGTSMSAHVFAAQMRWSLCRNPSAWPSQALLLNPLWGHGHLFSMAPVDWAASRSPLLWYDRSSCKLMEKRKG